MLFTSFTDLIAKGGYTILVLIVCSIVALKVVIEKSVVIRGISEKLLDELKNKILSSIDSRDLKEASYIIKFSTSRWLFFTVKSPLSTVAQYIIENYRLPKDELLDAAYRRMDKELMKLEKGLGILATLGSISPFIGLFGTVIGIIRSFQALALNEASGYLNVMSGIAEALVATAAGLIVAVPSVMFYNYFSKKIKHSIPQLEEAIDDIVRKLKYMEKETKHAPVQN
ncbi:MAG: MotA/TolQ/ExbB proton channel family protein [Bacteroidota bacterium]